MGMTYSFYHILNSEQTEHSLRSALETCAEEAFYPVVAYNHAAIWLPLFDIDLCGGAIATSNDAYRLSAIFRAPVLATALYDSDFMFISYADAEQAVAYDHICPNAAEQLDDEEDLAEQYSTDFPDFLLTFCDEEEELQHIWHGEYIFADERLRDILGLLHAEPVYDPDDIPEDYSLVTLEEE